MTWPARLLATASVLLGLGLGPARADDAGARVDVPIQQTVLPNGDMRYSVPVTIGGGPPVEAALDTGSFGLRVLASALSPSQYEATEESRNYPFSGGARLRGVLAKATIGVGGATTAAPILFQLVNGVDCVERQPRCPASRVSKADYRIAGDGIAGQGFPAIVGVSMRRATGVQYSADNPLGTIGDGRWIVILPLPGSTAPGHLIINPTADDTAGFTSIHLDPLSAGGDQGAASGWRDGALPGCLVNEASKERLCGLTMLDSGAQGFFSHSSDVTKPTTWRAGTPARFELKLGSETMTIPFSVGQGWPARVHVLPERGSGEARLSAGALPFFSYAVLYDAKAGTMGFKARTAEEP